MGPDQAKSWLQAMLPYATAGGPFLTLGLAVVMAISLYWMNSWITDCAQHNRLLSAQLITQQEKFHTEIMTRLAHCPPPR